MLELFKSARQVSVPILVVRTADQVATAEMIRAAASEHPVVQWDADRGLTVVPQPDGTDDKKATQALSAAFTKSKIEPNAVQFNDAIRVVLNLPKGSVVLAHNAHRQLTSSEPYATAQNVQAVANLRDIFKMDHRMLVMMAPIFVSPPELEHDIVVVAHDLPAPKELEVIVKELHAGSKLKAPTSDKLAKAVDAISGLSSFAAEQVVSMSLRPDDLGGLDLDMLWERKRVTIEQTRGLRVWRGKERFDDLVGLDNVKAGLRQQLHAKLPLGVVVFIDEIDKVLANVEQDTSGVRMDQLRTLLTEMENNEWLGSVLMGVAGGGKSAVAKAFGNEAGVPTIALDLGDMEGPHVGESEAMLRHAMDVIKAVGRGRAFFLATSNNASVMRPELQRRFTEGMFFFDLMTEAERQASWAFYMKRYELKQQPLPLDDGWTGAEIRNCCRKAWNVSIPLTDAAQFIVPMAQSRVDEIKRLRQYAHGRFLDASKPGTYQYDETTTTRMEKQIRAINLNEVPGLAAKTVESVLTPTKES
jgi:hypothetical protein